ncbi:hypothetical protein VNI00_016525 [Paramarasmius palmivorus]|uniref:Uncharacterized protein n=1 Tax=Paramarasmius palmivorus TaxID=297713 RepID=A0AAW0BE44_9AGAR
MPESTPLPGHMHPYVMGFVLTPSDLRLLAKSLLPAKVFSQAESDGTYFTALSKHHFSGPVHQTLTGILGSEDYYWIVAAVPSLHGRQPKVLFNQRGAETLVRKYCPELRFERLLQIMTKWPEDVKQPLWFEQSMRDCIIALQKLGKLKVNATEKRNGVKDSQKDSDSTVMN